MDEEEGTIDDIPWFVGWKTLNEIYGEDICSKIREFQEKVKEDENTLDGCTLTAISDKEQRKTVHSIIRKAFPMFTSDTADDCIVLYSHKNQSTPFQSNPLIFIHRQISHRSSWSMALPRPQLCCFYCQEERTRNHGRCE